MTRAARIYDFTLPTAGAARELLVEGSYYRILTATGALEVRRDGGSALGPIYPGQGERAQFKRLTLVDKSGSANGGLLVVGDDTFIDDRITGEVAVIDGGKARTLANLAFSARMSCGAVAGQYSHCQIWNPSSTRRLVITSIAVSSSLAATVHWEFNASALGVLGVPVAPVSKLTGGFASVAQLRTLNNPTIASGSQYLGAYQVPANLTQIYRPTEPFIVNPGAGLYFANWSVAGDLIVTADMYEEAI